jgi:hypothetical protein
MASQAAKKQNKRETQNRKIWKAVILISTAIYIILNVYFYFTKENFEFGRSKTLSFLILTLINYCLYKMLDKTLDTMWFNYLVDLLIVNVSVQILHIFHWKFWFLYLLLPVYGLVCKAYEYYEHVKTVGKGDPSEVEQTARQGKDKTNSKGKKGNVSN